MITRNYFMSVVHHRSDGSQFCCCLTADITSFFPKEINSVKNDLTEALKKEMGEDSQTKVTDAQLRRVQIIAFNRI